MELVALITSPAPVSANTEVAPLAAPLEGEQPPLDFAAAIAAATPNAAETIIIAEPAMLADAQAAITAPLVDTSIAAEITSGTAETFEAVAAVLPSKATPPTVAAECADEERPVAEDDASFAESSPISDEQSVVVDASVSAPTPVVTGPDLAVVVAPVVVTAPPLMNAESATTETQPVLAPSPRPVQRQAIALTPVETEPMAIPEAWTRLPRAVTAEPSVVPPSAVASDVQPTTPAQALEPETVEPAHTDRPLVGAPVAGRGDTPRVGIDPVPTRVDDEPVFSVRPPVSAPTRPEPALKAAQAPAASATTSPTTVAVSPLPPAPSTAAPTAPAARESAPAPVAAAIAAPAAPASNVPTRPGTPRTTDRLAPARPVMVAPGGTDRTTSTAAPSIVEGARPALSDLDAVPQRATAELTNAPLAALPGEAPTLVRAAAITELRPASPESTLRTLEAVVATVRDLSTPERPSIEAVVRDAELGTVTIRASIERGTVRAEITVADPGHARSIAEAARERAVSDVAFAAISVDVRSGNGRAHEHADAREFVGVTPAGQLDRRPTVTPSSPVADGRLDLYA